MSIAACVQALRDKPSWLLPVIKRSSEVVPHFWAFAPHGRFLAQHVELGCIGEFHCYDDGLESSEMLAVTPWHFVLHHVPGDDDNSPAARLAKKQAAVSNKWKLVIYEGQQRHTIKELDIEPQQALCDVLVREVLALFLLCNLPKKTHVTCDWALLPLEHANSTRNAKLRFVGAREDISHLKYTMVKTGRKLLLNADNTMYEFPLVIVDAMAYSMQCAVQCYDWILSIDRAEDQQWRVSGLYAGHRYVYADVHTHNGGDITTLINFMLRVWHILQPGTARPTAYAIGE